MRGFLATSLARVLFGVFTLLLLGLHGAGAGTLQYSYDALGRLTGVSDGNGQNTTYKYDAAGNRIQVSQTASASAPTGTLTASSPTITAGQSVTLTWGSQNATSATIDNGVNTNNATSGTAIVSPTTTTTYRLSVTGAGGTVNPAASVTVAVNQPAAPTGSIAASPSTIARGGSSTLSWSSTNATSATLNGSAVAVSGSQSVSPTATATYTLVLTGPGGTYTPTPVQVTVNQPPTGTISASPSTITSGSSSTLTWSSSGATSATLNGNAVAVSGSQSVSPTATTTYTLVLTGPGGSYTPASAQVTVNYAPPVAVDDYVSAMVVGNNPVVEFVTGFDPRVNDTDPYGFPLTVTSAGGSAHGTVSVNTTNNMVSYQALNYTGPDTFYYTVSDGHGNLSTGTVHVSVAAAPTGSISANPTTIVLGGSSTLSWSSTNATSATLNGSAVAVSGSQSVSPAATTTYTLVLTGPGGTYTPTPVQVTVNQPPNGAFSASPLAIAQGASTTLSWSSNNVSSASIDNGIGAVSPNGSITVSPSLTTTYTLTLSGSGGSTTQAVTVTVYPPPTGTLTANPSSIISGSSSTLTWSSTNATSATLNGSAVAVSGSQSVSPTSTTTYTLALTGPGGNYTPTPARVTVTAGNQPPTAGNFSVNASRVSNNPIVDIAVNITPLTHCSDPDGDTLSVTAVGGASHGTVSRSGNSVTWQGAVNFSGTTDSFFYQISDGQGHTAQGTITVNAP